MEQQQTEIGIKPTPKKRKAKAKKPQSRAVSTVVKQPPAAPTPTNMLQVIATAVMDPRCDVTKMQALLDMQRQIEDRDSMKEFNRNFIALQEELPTIRQDGKIVIPGKEGRAGQATPYATFNSIMKVIKPLLVKHGFALSFLTEPAAERLLVKGLLEGHGHHRSTAFPLPAETSGSKNNVQGWGSSMSYGKRYCTIALLNIVSEAKEDADTDGFPGSGENVSPAQLKVLIKMADDAGADKAKFCEVMKVDSMADIPSSRFEEAKTQLQRKLNAKARKTAASDFPGDR